MSQNNDKEEDLYSDSGSETNSVTGSQEDQEEEQEQEPEYQEPEDQEEAEEKVEDEDENNDENNDEEQKNNAEFIPDITGNAIGDDDDDEEDDDDDKQYLQKFNAEINKNYIVDFHPECCMNNYDEISVLTRVVRDKNNNIVDNLHRTIPFLTKYERTRVIGQRAKQINSGAKVFVKVPENVIDGYLIAELELAEKRVPFIIRRPIPGGGCEYWSLKDLEIVSF
jgi:DNA-directed RNA polymerase I, II, and III subunit RPABC2